MILYPLSRAFSLRNLVLEYGWGRVNIHSQEFSPFSRPVETWRQFGWLRMVLTRCASSERGWHARSRGECVGSLVGRSGAIKRTVECWLGKREFRSLTSKGNTEPLCTEIKRADREVSWGGSCSLTTSQRGAASGQVSWRGFSGMHRVLTCWMLARAPASPA